MKNTPSDIAQSFYILGIAPGASKEAVREAFRRYAKVFHPDRIDQNQVKCKEVLEARFKVLAKAHDHLRSLGLAEAT